MLITNAAVFREIVGTLVLDHTVSHFDSNIPFRVLLLACFFGWLAGCKLERIATHTRMAYLSFPCVSTFGTFLITIVTFPLQKEICRLYK